MEKKRNYDERPSNIEKTATVNEKIIQLSVGIYCLFITHIAAFK